MYSHGYLWWMPLASVTYTAVLKRIPVGHVKPWLPLRGVSVMAGACCDTEKYERNLPCAKCCKCTSQRGVTDKCYVCAITVTLTEKRMPVATFLCP